MVNDFPQIDLFTDKLQMQVKKLKINKDVVDKAIFTLRWRWFWELLDAQLNLKVSITSRYLGLDSVRGLRNRKGHQAVSNVFKGEGWDTGWLCGRRNVRSCIRTKAGEVEPKEKPLWNKAKLWKRLLRSWVFYFSCSKMFNKEETSERIQWKNSRI